ILFFLLVAIFGDMIAPYDVDEMHRDANGDIKKVHKPSADHWFGTTNYGRDVFSQVIAGTRTAIIVGGLAAILVTLAGTTIGIVSGYFGGWVDSLLMRIVDIFFAFLFFQFLFVFFSLLKPRFWNLFLAVFFLYLRKFEQL